MTNKTEYTRAYEEGKAARRNGTRREANAYQHRRGRDGELLRERWMDGWDDEAASRRGASL